MSMSFAVKNLTKYYANNKSPALKNVSFDVPEKGFIGLIGENGSGKTTLISILCGLLSQTSGTVVYSDANNSLDEFAQRIALVPQEIALYPTLTLKENLRFFGSIYGVFDHELNKAMERVLELVQLEDVCNKQICEFSGGMKRRANLAASLLHNPEIIFLDEPTVHVDPVSRQVIFQGLKKLNEQGITLVYTSHYMEEIENLCSDVIILHKGEIVAHDSPEGLIQNNPGCKNLTEVFFNLSSIDKY